MRLLLQRNQVAESITLFNETAAREKSDDRRRRLVSDFLFAMADADHVLEAYAAAPDPDQALLISGGRSNGGSE